MSHVWAFWPPPWRKTSSGDASRAPSGCTTAPGRRRRRPSPATPPAATRTTATTRRRSRRAGRTRRSRRGRPRRATCQATCQARGSPSGSDAFEVGAVEQRLDAERRPRRPAGRRRRRGRPRRRRPLGGGRGSPAAGVASLDVLRNTCGFGQHPGHRPVERRPTRRSGSYQAKCGRSSLGRHRRRATDLMVWTATPRSAHTREQRLDVGPVGRVLQPPRSCRAAAPSRTGSARGCAGGMPAMRVPWPVTPMKRTRPSSRARASASTAPPGPVGHLPLLGLDQVVQLDQVDRVDPQPLQRPLQLGPGAVAGALAGLGGEEEPVAVLGHPRPDPQLGVAVATRRCRCGSRRGAAARRARASARSWRIDPRAAAPKIVRVLWWPVRPKGAVGNMMSSWGLPTRRTGPGPRGGGACGGGRGRGRRPRWPRRCGRGRG